MSSEAHVLTALTDLARRLSAAEQAIAGLAGNAGNDSGPGGRYKPAPAPQLWRWPPGEDDSQREELTGRLRSWVEKVYRPGYGHLAARLPACWQRHDLCLYVLDALCELHCLLYLNTERTAGDVAGAGELLIRIMPQAADLMAREGGSCDHRLAGNASGRNGRSGL